MKAKTAILLISAGLLTTGGLLLAQDQQQPSEWASESWKWAKAQGLTDGRNPQRTCTREMVIAWLHRLEMRRAIIASDVQWERGTGRFMAKVIHVRGRLNNTGDSPVNLRGVRWPSKGGWWHPPNCLFVVDAYDGRGHLVSTTQPCANPLAIEHGATSPNPVPPGGSADLEATITDDPSIAEIKIRFLFLKRGGD